MFRALRLYRLLLGVQLRSQMQFRSGFALDVFSTGLIVVLEFGALALVFDKFGDIRGWSLAEVAFLYGSVELAFGLMDWVFSGFDPRRFGQEVRLGSFDQMLLRPMSTTLQVLGSDFPIRRIGQIVVSCGILFYALSNLNVAWRLETLLYYPVVLLSMVLFFGGLFIIGATITFWTIESIEAINVLTYGGQVLISYPMHIYDRWMRRTFTYIIPAIFLNYYPALYILDKPDPLGLPSIAPFLAPLVGLGMFAVALLYWGYGIRHYRSTGT